MSPCEEGKAPGPEVTGGANARPRRYRLPSACSSQRRPSVAPLLAPPVAAETGRDRQRPRAEAAVECARHRRPQVGQIVLDKVEPPWRRPGHARPPPRRWRIARRTHRDADQVFAVPRRRAGSVPYSRIVSSIQKRSARRRAEEALVEERGERVEVGVADVLRRLERAAAGEDARARERAAAPRLEEVVATTRSSRAASAGAGRRRGRP